MDPILQTTFQTDFLVVELYLEVWDYFSLLQSVMVDGLDNELGPNSRYAIIWTNDGLVYWSKYPSPGLNELLFAWLFKIKLLFLVIKGRKLPPS